MPQDREALREDPRFQVELQAAVQCPDWQAAETIAAGNVSKGGMFLRTAREFQIGARVEVTLQLPDERAIVLPATVRHVVAADEASGRPAGVGVEVDATSRNELLALIDIARLRQGKPLSTAGPLSATPTGARRRVAFPQGKQAGIVGIDFGVSYSCLAVAVDDTVYTVPDALGRGQIPSLVGFPEGGAPVIGWDARKLQAERPDRTVASVKRLLGRQYDEQEVAGFVHSAPYRTSQAPDGTTVVEIGDQSYPVVQIAALIIAQLKQSAEAQTGVTVDKAVLSHPVSFTAPQTQALQRAAELAGLEVSGMVSEPLAAALGHGHGLQQTELIAAYDFGGGTFDFTVLELSASQFRVLGSAGDPWLGGDDFDIALAHAVANTFWRKTRVELPKRVVEWQRLVLACERAKRRLSVDDQSAIDLPQIVRAPEPLDLRQMLDRGALQRVCEALFERSTAVCQQVLDQVGLRPDQLARVVLAGGTTRIPFVREHLGRLFGATLGKDVSPDDAVALGAGLYAARLVGHPALKAQSLTP